MSDLGDLRWRSCRFEELTTRELQNIYMARQMVFAVEQACAFLDADGCDEQAFHLAAWAPAHRTPLAYARLLDPGVKYTEPSMGRVLTTAAGRGRGLGRELVSRAIAVAGAAWPGVPNRISAQARLERFYASFGYVTQGPAYLEDGIPHLDMLRR